jgi:serine/threonine protein kinase
MMPMCRDEWEIDINKLELGEQLGAGGHGQVHKGLWKGTEVAVKMMIPKHITHELERNFKDEVPTNAK